MQHECIQPEIQIAQLARRKHIKKPEKKKKKKNSSNVRSIGEQSTRDCGSRLGEGGCKDGISVL